MMRTTTEALGIVLERQMVVTDSMKELLDELGFDARVRVTTRSTPWGNFVMSIVPAECEWCGSDVCSPVDCCSHCDPANN